MSLASIRTTPSVVCSTLALLVAPLTCGSGAGPDCKTKEVKTRLFNDQQTMVNWTIEVCVTPGEPPMVTVDVSGKTVPGGDPVTPSSVVVVERNSADQRVESHGGHNNSTVTFDADPQTEKLSVTVGRHNGHTATTTFSLSE